MQGFTKEVYEAIVSIVDQRMREIRVTREDFDELRAVVRELAEAQKRTEARVEELAEAQKRTEARVEELAEAQKRTEARLDSLTLRVEELAEAQKRTEARVEELAEAQKRTEARLDSLAEKVELLAEAQAKTEKVVQGLVKDMRSVKKQLAGLSDTVGYGLEDRAIKSLPGLLRERLSLDVRVMDRRFLEYPDGGDDEINIYGEGVLDDKPAYVIGESKAQLGRKDVGRFRKLIERVRKHLDGFVIPLLVVYSVRPEVERYALKNIPDILIIKSYEL